MKRSTLFLMVLSILFSAIVVQAQGLDLHTHCRNHGRERAVLVENTVYGFRCEDAGGTLWDISIESACDEQYGSASTAQYSDYNDPYSWYCETPSGSSSSSNVPSNQSQGRGCDITYFEAWPSGQVELGTDVELYGESTCGTTKFQVDGVDKAETGQPNNSEVWRTEESGTGWHEVCFLARGNGGWANADTRCLDIEVVGSSSSSNNTRNNDTPDTIVLPQEGSASSCDAWLPVDIGDRARITAGEANRLRSGPGTGYSFIQSLPAFTEFTVLSGPYCSDGHTWIELRLDNGTSGYTVAVGSGGDEWVEEVSEPSTSNDIQTLNETFYTTRGLGDVTLDGEANVTYDSFQNRVRVRSASVYYSVGGHNMVNFVCHSRASIFIYDEDNNLLYEERGPAVLTGPSLRSQDSDFAVAPFLSHAAPLYVEFWVVAQCFGETEFVAEAGRDPDNVIDRIERSQDFAPDSETLTITVYP